MSDERPLCVDLGLGQYADDRCIDPTRCQMWGYCLQSPETFDFEEAAGGE